MKQRVAAPYRHLKRLLAQAFIATLFMPSAHADLLSTFSQLFDPPDQTPHPAVVRIYAQESDALASGSGTLVHADQQHGYVLTNWHVVREAEDGQVVAIFSDGFESAATVLKTDERWDLALLKIWRPNSSPMPLSMNVPAIGEPLTIIGYGSGTYRAANGRCLYYAAPDNQSPQEMIEVSVAARQGDSGGPIVNKRGELAAVLFGSGQGITTGTHIGRVVSFLNSVAIPETPKSTEQVAADRVIEPKKTQQASLVTQQQSTGVTQQQSTGVTQQQSTGVTQQQSTGVTQQQSTGDDKTSQYYQLPPLEWSTVEDETAVVAATAQSAAAQAQIAVQPTPASFSQVKPLLSSRSVATHNSHWTAAPTNRIGAQYSTYLDSYGGGENSFEDAEVVQLPKINLRRLLMIVQSILALVGLVTLLEKIRN